MFQSPIVLIFTHADRWSSPAVIGNPPPPYANFSLTLMGESRAGLFGGDGGQESSNTLFIIELGRQCVVCVFVCVQC